MRRNRARWFGFYTLVSCSTLAITAAIMGCASGANSPSASSPAAPNPPASAASSASTKPNETSAPASSSEMARGIKALEDGEINSAVALFDIAVKKNPKDPEATYYLGLAQEKAGNRVEAEKLYKQALKLRPDLENASINLGALYIDARKLDDAIAVSKEAIAKHPEIGALHFNLALALAEKKDEAGATAAFEESVKKAPTAAEYSATFGHYLALWKKGDKAAEQLRAAMLRARDDFGLLTSIGHEMLLLRQVSDCILAFDKAIAVKEDAPARTERALCKIAAKDDAGALVDLRAAITKDSRFALPHYWVGQILLRENKPKEALPEFEAYLKLEPNGAKAKEASERVKAIKQKK